MKLTLTAALAALMLTTTLAQAAPVKLKFAHFWGANSGPHQDFALGWADQVTKCSGGDITFEFYTAGTQLGNVTKLEDELRAGLVDLAHGLNHLPRNRFTQATAIDTPLLSKSAYANSMTLWTLYKEGAISKPYEGLQVLALHAHAAGLIHTKGKAVRLPEDLKGMRIRSPSPAAALMLQELGAVPVGLPPGETYEAISKGTADGTIFPWEGVAGFKLAEVLDYSSDLKLNAASFWFAMNENKYKSLSDAQRKCIDDASYEPLVKKAGDYWAKWDKPGLEQTKAAGNEIIEPDAAAQAAWQEAMKPVIVSYLASLKQDGFADAEAVYHRAQQLVPQFEAEYLSRK